MNTDIFTKDFQVTFRHIDRSGLFSPVAALDFLEEAAVNHAELLGVGYEAMMAKRWVWILSRISVRIDKRPRLHDVVTVSSWPRGRDRLFAVRDYEITGDGRSLVRGRSNWVVFDLDKRRPVRPEEIMDSLPLNDGKNALTESPPALGEMVGLTHAASRKALYADLDFNGHVHNTRYIHWICDLFDPEAIEKAPSIGIDINYLKEITALSVTDLWFGEIDGVYHIEGRQEGGPVFRAQVTFYDASARKP